MLNWNMNIVNSYTISVLERIKNLESFIVSPEINFAKIRELGKTRLKKALLVYSKLKGMTIDVDIAENKDEVITNKENDRFNIIRNEYGTEIFLDKPLNIINIEEDIKKLNVDIIVLEFTTETIDEIRKVLKQLKTRKGEYREYNYKRGGVLMSGHNHKLIKNLATCFGLGEMSFMPGTFGTLGGIPIFLFLTYIKDSF